MEVVPPQLLVLQQWLFFSIPTDLFLLLSAPQNLMVHRDSERTAPLAHYILLAQECLWCA